jgi:MoaA/NifB/PqqE/SkfB family radical SAM enzyme
MIVTHRCNLRCAYCGFPDLPSDEMDADQWLEAIHAFLQAGTLRMGFSGGEPLLRQDLDRLLKAAHGNALVTLNTNGLLLPERKDLLKWVDAAVISLDGNQEVHDGLRGQGAYAGAVQGGEAVLKAGKKLIFAMVVTKDNTNQIPHVLRLSEDMGAQCFFQPVTPCAVSSGKAASMLPDLDEFKRGVRFLQAAKRRGKPVCCSRSYLESLMRYPNATIEKAQCKLGLYGGFVTPSGQVCRCHVNLGVDAAPSGRDLGFVEAFRRMPMTDCQGCFIYPYVELSNLLSGKLLPIYDALRQATIGWRSAGE